MSEERIYYLLNAYTSKIATAAEEEELFHWVTTMENDVILNKYIHHLTETQAGEKFPEVDWDNLYEKIVQQAGKDKPHPRVKNINWYKIAAAAVLGLLIVSSIYWFLNEKQQPDVRIVTHIAQQDKNDIKPGGTKAILQAGNMRVTLSKEDTSFSLAGNTVYINGGDVRIADVKSVQYTLLTPKGGEYRLVLADGTKVWLNADSKLIYPSVFTSNTREVTLIGEAYFEVKTDAIHPFIVKSNNQHIKVLGTELNVQAYPDEKNIVTTLVKGKVQVNSENEKLVLKPGQQTVLNRSGQISLNSNADVEQAIAWKEGYFRFDKADIHTIMKQLARWYDIKVNYSDSLSNHYFGAIISRDNNISGILNMLEATGDVQFKITGNEVTVVK